MLLIGDSHDQVWADRAVEDLLYSKSPVNNKIDLCPLMDHLGESGESYNHTTKFYAICSPDSTCKAAAA